MLGGTLFNSAPPHLQLFSTQKNLKFKTEMHKKEKTLFRTLLLGIISICMIAVLVLLLYLFLHSTPVYLHKLSQELEGFTVDVSDMIASTLKEYQTVVGSMSKDAELTELILSHGITSRPEIYRKLYEYRKQLNQRVTLHLLPGSRNYAVSLGYNIHEYIVGDYAGIDQLLQKGDEPIIIPKHFINTNGDEVALVVAEKITYKNEILAYLYLDIPSTDIQNLLQTNENLRKANLSPYISCFISTWYDYLVYQNSSLQHVFEGNNLLKGEFIDTFKQIEPASKQYLDNEIEYLISGCENPDTRFITICSVRLDYFLRENQKNIWPVIMMCLFVAAIGFVIAWKIHREILSPINNILDTLRRFDAGDMQVRCHFETNNELAQIRNQLNQLIMDVDQAMKNNKEKQELLMLAENNMLKAQIKPHFLNNVLESIYWMIKIGKIDEACVALTSIGKITTARMNFMSDFFEMVNESIELTQRYITLQQICYPDKFDTIIDISSEDSEVMIPVFLLQPLVENAIVHGLQPKRGHGTLRISTHRDTRFLYIVIGDDGIGMDKAALDRAFEPNHINHGIALYNIYRRLNLHYGADGKIEIHSEVDKGTLVTVRIPLKGEQKSLCFH